MFPRSFSFRPSRPNSHTYYFRPVFSNTHAINGRRTLARFLKGRERPGSFKWKKISFLGIGASALMIYLCIQFKAEKTSFEPTHFSPMVITKCEITSKDTKLIRLKVPSETSFDPTGMQHPVWSVYMKDTDIQIERPYTPLEGMSESGEMEFWIKRYPDGEMGRWLHSKKVGDIIEIRGPECTWNCDFGSWDDVVMISGGTGIAPFLQLLHSYFTTARVKNGVQPRFTLLQSYRSMDDCLPTRFLNKLLSWCQEHSENLRVYTFADTTKRDRKSGTVSLGRRMNKEDIESVLRRCSGRTVVLVCGPESMVTDLAGPRASDLSQGPLQGILGELRQEIRFDVWKM